MRKYEGIWWSSENRKIRWIRGRNSLLLLYPDTEEIIFSGSENTCVRSIRRKSFPETNCLRNVFVLVSRSFPTSQSRSPTTFGERCAPGSLSERKEVA